MSFHPNDIARRARAASIVLAGMFVLLLGAFFRTQVLQNSRYALAAEKNRLREVPLPAARGTIYDRNGQVIAENVPGYSVSILSPTEDSLRASLKRLSGLIPLTAEQITLAARRFKAAPKRPTVVLADAPFDQVSVLEEHRMQFPSLIVQSAPKRFYPDREAVGSFVGYVGEITQQELSQSKYDSYKIGQQVGKAGLEKEYEAQLRGREGVSFVEVDVHERVVQAGARPSLPPVAAEPLRTNIDLDLQKYVVSLFGDSIEGGAIALEPHTGAVLALHSAPTFDPNKFVGGISNDDYSALRDDPRKPLYNKVVQGIYPPGSTFKLATAAIAMEQGIVTLEDHMPVPCTGGFTFGNRYYKCHKKEGHGNLTLQGAIEQSCDVYFYQLGLKMQISRLIAGGVSLGFNHKTGIDLPGEVTPRFPYAIEYLNKLYPGGWSQGLVLSLAIGQGENAQTVANMARFYTALATDGRAAKPEVRQGTPERTKIFTLSDSQLVALRESMIGVMSRGTGRSAAIQGVVLAGKTGTAQITASDPRSHAWFTGFAPAEDPKIVVAVMLEFGGHGDRAARFASKIVEHYLKVTPKLVLNSEAQ